MHEQEGSRIKQVMDELLQGAGGSRHDVRLFFAKVMLACTSQNIDFVDEVAFGYWWELVHLGALVPVGKTENVPCLPVFDAFVLTDRGRRFLKNGGNSPHDPGRYMAAVRQRVRNPDEIALSYLDEAVGAWKARLHRSSVVMLGCACERLVLILAEHIASVNVDPWSGKVQKALRQTPLGISRLFGLIRESLPQLKHTKLLPGALGDALDRRLSPIFDHARGLRNQCGHPCAMEVSAEDAEAGLLLFPGFYKLVDELCQQLCATEAEPSKGNVRPG